MIELSTSSDAQALRVGLSRVPGGAVLRVWTGARVVQTVAAGGALAPAATRAALDAAATGFFVDGAYTWVRLAPSQSAVTVELR